MAWILDARHQVVAKNSGDNYAVEVTATLPADGTYYIAFRDQYLDDATFLVQLDGQSARPDFYSCQVDADCVAVPKVGCCHNGYLEAVNANEVDAYESSFFCNEQILCPQFIIDDTRVAECNTATRKCEMVAPEDIHCGGFTANPHACPNGYDCQSQGIPDLPGQCVAAN
jgi:hypothetical protein